MDSTTFNPEPLWIARKRLKLTQSEVAKRLGKHRFTIIRIETGTQDVSRETIRQYAEMLGVDPAEVLGPEPVGA